MPQICPLELYGNFSQAHTPTSKETPALKDKKTISESGGKLPFTSGVSEALQSLLFI